jgi:ketosteroid isomerase-like protein
VRSVKDLILPRASSPSGGGRDGVVCWAAMEEGKPAPQRQRAEEMYRLFNEREVDALLELAAPEIEWDWSRSIGPDRGLLQGREAVRDFLETNWEHWESIEMRPEDILEAGDEVIVSVLVRLRGRDGIEVEARGTHVQTWQGGRLARYRLFQERAEALEAVGVRSSTG